MIYAIIAIKIETFNDSINVKEKEHFFAEKNNKSLILDENYQRILFAFGEERLPTKRGREEKLVYKLTKRK